MQKKKKKKKKFSEENKLPRALFEARRRWQGPPRVNKVARSELVLSF